MASPSYIRDILAARAYHWLSHVGLGRPEVRAWALYDWANSAFFTTVVATIFPIYFSSVAAAHLPPAVATARFATATTIALTLIAIAAPILCVVADYAAIKKKLLAVFLALGVCGTAGMAFIQQGEWIFAALLFVVADMGAAGSLIFYDALLPHIASPEELDRISTAGYALGYLSGGLLLALNLAWIQYPEFVGLADAAAAARLSFLSVAAWWLVFSLPLFRHVPEPRRQRAENAQQGEPLLHVTLTRLGGTLKALRVYRQAFIFLAAFLFYNDGISTIIRMATIYGTEIGIPQGALITAILLVQFVGLPCSFLFGSLAERIGTKAAIFLALAVYGAVSLVGYYMQTAWHFYILALLVGTVQGGSQALSRSLFASMLPPTRSAEFFAFFAVCEKIAGIFGPAIFAGTIMLTGSSRKALLIILVFFIVGGWLLARVDVAEGQRIAREMSEGEEQPEPQPPAE
ncbi:MAG: MFS transporter [Deltaproteobacteria bacterium]|nr:MFS transporter [Deltaproteobacteria bacterium]